MVKYQINLKRAKELDPTVTDLTTDNAGDLVSKAGLTVRAKAECESKFTELLTKQDITLSRKEVKDIPYVAKSAGNQGGSAGDDDVTEM